MNVDVVSVEGSIGSEKVAVGENPRTTPVAPFGGVVPDRRRADRDPLDLLDRPAVEVGVVEVAVGPELEVYGIRGLGDEGLDLPG